MCTDVRAGIVSTGLAKCYTK
ncbi:hypothetical protein A2U01_0114868, partial [Trifolium medium]|nr:hypothetical protein [Trifolium medium]